MSATATSPSHTPKELASITRAVRFQFKLNSGTQACDLCKNEGVIHWSAYGVKTDGSQIFYGWPAVCPRCVIRHGRDAVLMAARSECASLAPDEEIGTRESYMATLAQFEAGLFDLPLVLTEEMVDP